LLRRLGSRLRPPGPVAEPSGYDAWLRHYFADRLDPIEAACASAGESAFELFRDLDDDLWAVLLTREYSAYPRIRALLPGWPEISIQERWNGWTGLRLLNESKAFYALARRIYADRSPLSLDRSRVLDFGCGWGRLTRFFVRDVGPGALYGCDPVQEIIDVCERTRVPARLARCDYVPDRLPFEERFDFVFAFSVFTHLSERAHRACLESIHASLEPGGLLLVTVRPPEYLRHCERMHPLLDSLGPDFLAALQQPRYLYVPHPADDDHPQFHGAEMTHGETVISLAYVRERWSPLFELLDVFMLSEDPHQVVLALRRRG
jgi:SAM-dependent methyltransferase